MSLGSFKNVILKCVSKSFILYVYEKYLALNNLQCLI